VLLYFQVVSFPFVFLALHGLFVALINCCLVLPLSVRVCGGTPLWCGPNVLYLFDLISLWIFQYTI
jgi:hypothetical protein